MEQSYYRIGEVSRATGLSKDTLHFYDKISLLSHDYVDPQNGYRYYSLRNLWQLDIITTCRKLNIPLDTVRQILSLQDNAEIVRLLMEYREEALRRSAYYQQVAEDILWYKEEHRRIEAQKDDPPLVRQVWREAEQVIAGRAAQGGSQAYHVNMQQAAQAELQQAASIRRRYGYLLDGAGMPAGQVIKLREYVRTEGPYRWIDPDALYTIPAGRYAVFTLRIRQEQADFSPLLDWLAAHGEETDAIYAEELGVQLFPYMDNYACEVRAHLKEKAQKGA